MITTLTYHVDQFLGGRSPIIGLNVNKYFCRALNLQLSKLSELDAPIDREKPVGRFPAK